MIQAFSLKNLVKSYPDFRLGPLNLDLAPGTVLGYIGPNGSGKTTTLHAMIGLIKADAGEIEIFGRPNDSNKTDWKLDIGYVGDLQVFYENWSAERNLQFISRFYPDWSDSLAADLAKRFEIPLSKKAKELSGGNRVKLSLIAALAHKPKLLLLDEPTAGLDPLVRSELLDELFHVLESGERAIFYSTHILSDISRLADELVFLNEGQIFQRAAKDDLLDKWRRISFHSDKQDLQLAKVIQQEQEGHIHQVISYDHEMTIAEINRAGAANITVNRMSIDEIAVQILKEVKNNGKTAL